MLIHIGVKNYQNFISQKWGINHRKDIHAFICMRIYINMDV
jgi:hypothetical protein